MLKSRGTLGPNTISDIGNKIAVTLRGLNRTDIREILEMYEPHDFAPCELGISISVQNAPIASGLCTKTTQLRT